jgi:NADH dehydrogenase (ubiquinone) 1 beta subcomplex subunit 3
MDVYSEAWRYTGPFSRMNRFRGVFPGFGIGLAAFGVYMVYEQMFMKSSHGHGEGHGEEHH